MDTQTRVIMPKEVSDGALSNPRPAPGPCRILTHWRAFEQYEASHADYLFKNIFDAVGIFCTDTYEIGYEMLWPGEPDSGPNPKQPPARMSRKPRARPVKVHALPMF